MALKVVLISFGFGEYSVRLASALAHEARVCLMVPHWRAAPYLSALDEDVAYQPLARIRLRQPLQQIGMVSRIVRRILDFEPDVIHLQQGHPWFNLALPLLARFPLVLTIHDPRPHLGDRSSRRVPQPIIRFGFRRADHIIVHARQQRQEVVELLHVSSHRVHVIPHIAIGDETAQAHVEEENHSILFFGRIWEYKGLEYLIRAEPLITAQIPDVRIVIAGHGENFDRYPRMMVHQERFIIYNHFITDNKRAELFRRASVVVLPYVDASQSGIIPLAYKFSRPVVATAVGGLPEMVEHGRTGYVVPPRNEKELARAVVSLLRNGDLRRRFGANGKRKIDTECSPSVVAKLCIAVYRSASREEQPNGV